jgi:hypothetical protein
MVQKAKSQVSDDGFHFILWGVLVFVASISQYLMIVTNHIVLSSLPWIAMPAIGVPVAILYERNKGKTCRTRTYTEKLVGNLWQGYGISLALVIFITIFYGHSPVAFILVITGMATYVSGRAFQFKPLTLGSIIFWVAALCCIFVAVEEQLLVNAAAIALGYIIPGFMLWKKHKKVIHV